MKILFICKQNRFRSKVAATYMRKINKKIKVYDAGIIRGIPIAKTVKDMGGKVGININTQPGPVKEELLKQLDLVVIVADNVPASIFKGRVKKVVVWKITDTNQSDKKGIEKRMKAIMEKVDKLNEELK